MKRTFIVLLICNMVTFAFAQQRQIDEAIRRGENMLGAYVMSPNMDVIKLRKWFANNSQWMLVDNVETEKHKEFGFIKDLAVRANFIPSSRVGTYKVKDLLFRSMEAGNIKKMVFTIGQHRDLELGDLLKKEIARQFAENYRKCIEIHVHGGVNSRTLKGIVLTTKFYRKPTDDEKTLAEDMKTFLALCPECQDHEELKKAALEYTKKVKGVDFRYYYDIFHDYGDMSAEEINRFDNETFQKTDTKEGVNYYLYIFPEGKHISEVKELLAGGLYKRQIRELENIIEETLAVIKNLNGFGLSRDIVVDKGLVSSFWSALFGASGRTTLYHADARFGNYLHVANNFRSDFAGDDVQNKMNLADRVIDYLTVIDGLWASNVQLAQSRKMLGGLWTAKDAWEGYVEDYADDGLFKQSECAETPKCREIRVRIENAMKVLSKIEAEDRSQSKQLTIFEQAHLYLTVRYDGLISQRDFNVVYCKLAHEERRRKWYAEQCAKCKIDWKKTLEADHKIVMENENTYEYKYDGQWRVPGLLWFESEYDSFEEMLMRFLEDCAGRYCK